MLALLVNLVGFDVSLLLVCVCVINVKHNSNTAQKKKKKKKKIIFFINNNENSIKI